MTENPIQYMNQTNQKSKIDNENQKKNQTKKIINEKESKTLLKKMQNHKTKLIFLLLNIICSALNILVYILYTIYYCYQLLTKLILVLNQTRTHLELHPSCLSISHQKPESRRVLLIANNRYTE